MTFKDNHHISSNTTLEEDFILAFFQRIKEDIIFQERSYSACAAQLLSQLLIIGHVVPQMGSWSRLSILIFFSAVLGHSLTLIMRMYMSRSEKYKKIIQRHSLFFVAKGSFFWIVILTGFQLSGEANPINLVFGFFYISGLASFSIYSIGHRKDLYFIYVGGVYLSNIVVISLFPIHLFDKSLLLAVYAAYGVFAYRAQSLFYADWLRKDELFKAQSEIARQRILIESAMKMATLGEMSSSLAHEINTPISIIDLKARKLHQHLASQQHLDKVAEDQIQAIYKTVERISQIIKGLRVFTREVDQDPFEKVNIYELVENTLSFSRQKIEFEGIQLVLNIDKNLHIFCSPTQMSQVILNLIQNSMYAIKYTETKTIEIGTEVDSEKVTLYIADTGVGIDEKIKDKIFHPLFTTKNPNEGTGLGLSISKGLVELNKASIRFDPEYKNGTKMIIEFSR